MSRIVRVGLKFIVVFLMIFFVVIFWGTFVEPHIIDEQHFDLKIPHLADSWKGKRIAVIADLQVGMWLDNESTIEEMVDRIQKTEPSILLIAGDFIYHPFESEAGEPEEVIEEFTEEQEDMKEDWKERIHEVIQILAPLKNSRSSIFAVLGNHDYAMERPGVLSSPWLAHRLEIQLEKIGIQVLNNESHKFRNEKNDILYIVGVGPHYPGQDEPIAALESVPDDAPRIVFMHNPLSFKKIPSHAAPIAIAAHTHGGQIRIPFLPDWSWLNIVEDQEIDVDGWINDYGSSGNHLYINRGIGFSIFPIRINCPPELTIFTLS